MPKPHINKYSCCHDEPSFSAVISSSASAYARNGEVRGRKGVDEAEKMSPYLASAARAAGTSA